MAEDAYVRGYRHGQAHGPANRPDEGWLRSPRNPRREPFPEDYLDGYDDGAAGRPCYWRDDRLTEYDEEPEALGFRPVTTVEAYPLLDR